MFFYKILFLVILGSINLYAGIATRADEFFNREDITNQSTDYPNLGILSDVGVGLRLVQTRSHALKKMNWAIKAEMSDSLKIRKKLEKTLDSTNELLREKANRWPKERLDIYRSNKLKLERDIFVLNEEILFEQKQLLTSSKTFKHLRYQNIVKQQSYIRKFAAFGVVLTLVDLTGQFITDLHSPGENDHILGSGVWEFLEVTVEHTYQAIDEILSDEKIQLQLDEKLRELEAKNFASHSK